MDCSPPGSSVHGDSPGKNIGVGCHALLHRIFLTPDRTYIPYVSIIGKQVLSLVGELRPYMLHQLVSSVAQSYLTLCDSMECSTPGFPVHHQLPELTQTHVH